MDDARLGDEVILDSRFIARELAECRARRNNTTGGVATLLYLSRERIDGDALVRHNIPEAGIAGKSKSQQGNGNDEWDYEFHGDVGLARVIVMVNGMSLSFA